MPTQVEDAVISLAIDYPALSQRRVSNEPGQRGIIISGGDIRSIQLAMA